MGRVTDQTPRAVVIRLPLESSSLILLFFVPFAAQRPRQQSATVAQLMHSERRIEDVGFLTRARLRLDAWLRCRGGPEVE